MAGNPADLTVYKDDTITHDHSYYGKGCKNGWGSDGSGGSITPCADSDAGGRYVVTSDGETQKNGTYMNFQAASSGSGATIATQNAVTPDTFCPLGWQLPYSGTGGDYYDKSRSWNYIFTAYGIGFNDGTAADSTKIKSYPLSYVYSGFYDWRIGRLYNQNSNGSYWSSAVVNSASVYLLNTWPSAVRSTHLDSKARGYAFRCVLGISNLKALHGIRVRL